VTISISRPTEDDIIFTHCTLLKLGVFVFSDQSLQIRDRFLYLKFQ